MADIERKWIGIGTGALGALAFDDEGTAHQYAQDCGAGVVVEFVRADAYWGAVEALRDLADAAHRDRTGSPLPYEEWRLRYETALNIVGGR